MASSKSFPIDNAYFFAQLYGLKKQRLILGKQL